MPERSAWAAGNQPAFSLFICALDGVVPASFFPSGLGELTTDGLVAAGKATSRLSAHAQNLLFVHGVNWPATPHSEPRRHNGGRHGLGGLPRSLECNIKARGLQDKSLDLWTNGIAERPSDSFKDVPIIIWGDGGGHLKRGVCGRRQQDQ